MNSNLAILCFIISITTLNVHCNPVLRQANQNSACIEQYGVCSDGVTCAQSDACYQLCINAHGVCPSSGACAINGCVQTASCNVQYGSCFNGACAQGNACFALCVNIYGQCTNGQCKIIPCPAPPAVFPSKGTPGSCYSSDDPHIVSLDNYQYDFMYNGYYTVFQSGANSVVLGYEQCLHFNSAATCNCAIYINWNEAIFAMDICGVAAQSVPWPSFFHRSVGQNYNLMLCNTMMVPPANEVDDTWWNNPANGYRTPEYICAVSSVDPNTFFVRTNDPTKNIYVQLYVWTLGIQIVGIMPGSILQIIGVSGLCGNWDGYPFNDAPLSVGEYMIPNPSSIGKRQASCSEYYGFAACIYPAYYGSSVIPIVTDAIRYSTYAKPDNATAEASCNQAIAQDPVIVEAFNASAITAEEIQLVTDYCIRDLLLTGDPIFSILQNQYLRTEALRQLVAANSTSTSLIDSLSVPIEQRVPNWSEILSAGEKPTGCSSKTPV